MKRNAFENLIRWKEKDGRKPLIIQGARQVGKTWLMKEFAKTHYKNVAYVSFNDREDAKRIFDDSYDVDNIILSLSAVTGVRISPEDTLIIFDEIQECERALNVLKFFNENAPQYHIMAAGSLLGVAVRQKNMSFPVGQVEFLNLYPLTFGEFLDAVGEQQLSSLIFEHNAFKTIYVCRGNAGSGSKVREKQKFQRSARHPKSNSGRLSSGFFKIY